MDYKFNKCSKCEWWDVNNDGYPEVCFVCFNESNFKERKSKTILFSEFEDRVEYLETKNGIFGFGPIHKINIKYSDGSIFFTGWVDDNLMPILFGRAREQKLISDDIAYPKNDYPVFNVNGVTEYFIAEYDNIDEIIDLRFQSFFEGGANCISALQSLKHTFDNNHYTFIVRFNSKIVGLIYGYCASDNVFYIEYIYVYPKFRNKNIGARLLYRMEQLASTIGCLKIITLIQGTLEHVNPVFNFNKKYGFSYDKSGADDIGNGFVRLIMEKNI